jgi:hypothetical protein
LNAPESWHDSRIAQDLYLKLLDLSQGRLFRDSAFPKYGQVGSRLLSPMKEDAFQRLEGSEFRDVLF